MKLLVIIGALLLVVSSSASSEQTSTSLQQCTKINDSVKRLACFDRLTASSTPSKQVTTTKAKAVKKSPNPEPTISHNQEQFGNEHKKRNENLTEEITAVVTSVKLDANKKSVIQLDNGHTWKQADDKRFRLSKGNNVFIKRGALNAFYLGKKGLNKRIRVTRIK